MLSRNTVVEVNLMSFFSNIDYIKANIDSKIMLVVKSNAYGLGMVNIAKFAMEKSIDMLAVAFLEEAEKLRASGIDLPILIFNFLDSKYIENVIDKNYIVTIYSLDQIRNYYDSIGKKISDVKFHININTGMNRLGFDESELEELLKLIKAYKLDIDGIYSHFSNPIDLEYTKGQYRKLIKANDYLVENGVKIKTKHISNTSAALLYKEFNLDYVRIGMGAYGLKPMKKTEFLGIKSVLSWKTSISSLRIVKEGETIGYGNGFMSRGNLKVAVIPVGYSDGIPMQLSNKGYVLVDGEKCEIIGDVCMDQLMIDVTELNEVKIGDEVVLIGKQKSQEIIVDQIAKFSNTIPDDIISRIRKDIPRVYFK